MKRRKIGKRISGVILAAMLTVSSSTVVLAGGPQTEGADAILATEMTGAADSSQENRSQKEADMPESEGGQTAASNPMEEDGDRISAVVQPEEGETEPANEKVFQEQQQSEADDFNLNDWEFTFDGTTVLLKKYVGKAENIVVPGSITVEGKEYTIVIAKFYQGKDLKEIGAFYGNTTVKSVKFLEGVSFQENNMSYAFQESQVQSVYGIPDSVTEMEEAFRDSGIQYVDKLPQSLKNLRRTFGGCGQLKEAPAIPSGVEDLFSAFSDCISLKGAPAIPEGVTELDGTFSGCTGLQTIPVIANGVSSMTRTFEGCSGLTRVDLLPDTVVNMERTFKDCINLTAITKFPSKAAFLTGTFENCEKLTEIPDIPEGIGELDNTFEHCSSLQKMPGLPQSLKTMRVTFKDCSSLTQTSKIPDNVTTLDSTFENCKALKESPELPSRLYSMNQAFRGSGLETAPSIPGGVVDMSGAFWDCPMKKAPKLPAKVKYLLHTFDGSGITKAPDVPESAVDILSMFKNCSDLEGKVTIYAPLDKKQDHDRIGDKEYLHWPYAYSFKNAGKNGSGITVNYGEKCKVATQIMKARYIGNGKVEKGRLVLQVKFNANGGTVDRTSVKRYFNSKYYTLPTPQRLDYTFTGWYTKRSGGTKITSANRLTAKNNVWVYAQWKKTRVDKVSSFRLGNERAGSLLVTTKAVEGATGYRITCARNSSFTKDKRSLITAYTKKYIKGLEKGQRYYVKVRAYRKDATGKRIYGKYSTVKNFVVTK